MEDGVPVLPQELDDLLKQHPHVIKSLETAQTSPGFEKSLSVLNIWNTLNNAGKAFRSEVDPIEFGAKLLPHIVIVDVLQDEHDYKWRLFGGAHVDEYGTNLTGITLSELKQKNPNVTEVELIFDTARFKKEPVFYEIKYQNQNGNQRICRGIIAPLFSADGKTVEHLLGCSEWLND